jgi:hypothetical protein
MTSSLSRRSPTDFDVAARRPWLARAQLAARRRGPLVVLALIVGAVAALGISSLSGVKYQSTALIVVAGSPSTADGANSLAATYAGFIPEDVIMQKALANAIGVTDPTQYSSIGKSLVATVVANSAIVSLAFTASTPQQAREGLHVLVSDLTVGVLRWKTSSQQHTDCSVNFVGSRPQTRPPNTSIARAAAVQYYCPLSLAIPLFPASGYLVLVKDASAGIRSTPGKVKTGALGGVLGLLLGLVLAVAWERSDPRTDDLADLRSEVECPSWEGMLTPAAAISILAHWQQTVPDEQIQIGTVGVGRYDPVAVAQLQRTIQNASRNHGVTFRKVNLDGKSVFEGLDTKTPVVVLCVAQGTPLATLRDTVRRLGELAHTPNWAFLVPSGRVRDRSSPPTGPDLASLPRAVAEQATNGQPAAEQPRQGGPRRRIAQGGGAGRRNIP